MTTLTIPRDRLTTELKPGDHIIAIDGRPADHQVAGLSRIIVTAVGGIRLYNSTLRSGTEWNLYPDTQVERDVTIERADEPTPDEPKPAKVKPAKAKTPRMIRRTRHGLTLIHGRPLEGPRYEGTGYRAGWETEDRRYSITEGVAMTFCDGPHPMRWKDDQGVTHTGYCYGDEEHPYVVGWVIDGPQIPGVRELSEPHESFDEAWAFLAAALADGR